MERNHHLGDAPIQEELREKMNKLAAFLDRQFNGDNAQPRAVMSKDNRQWGFVMLVFPFGEGKEGRCNFISNGADRKDVVALMKEMIARFEGQPELKGHG